MVTYDQFIQAVEQKVREQIKAPVCVKIHTAQKNNGTYRRGLLFLERGSRPSPVIYLEEYYQRFKEESSVERVVREILVLYGRLRFQEPWQEKQIYDYKELRKKIVYRLINCRANQGILEDTPHIFWHDLALVFYVLLEMNECGMASMLIKREHLAVWEVSQRQLCEQACLNTPQLLPAKFQTMQKALSELVGEEETESGDVMYVLSNRICSFGAAAMLYPGMLERIAEELRENYYILPSSIHEVIVVRQSAAPAREELCALITEVNRTQLTEEEVLSDRIYFYDCSCAESGQSGLILI